MPFYEIIYENGDHSVACYDNEEEMLSAVKEHHDRAKNGLRGNPEGTLTETGTPVGAVAAIRVARVLEYEDHPGNTHDKQGATRVNSGPHESNFVAKEQKEHNPEAWGGEV